jgi:hypothetical protein
MIVRTLPVIALDLDRTSRELEAHAYAVSAAEVVEAADAISVAAAKLFCLVGDGAAGDGGDYAAPSDRAREALFWIGDCEGQAAPLEHAIECFTLAPVAELAVRRLVDLVPGETAALMLTESGVAELAHWHAVAVLAELCRDCGHERGDHLVEGAHLCDHDDEAFGACACRGFRIGPIAIHSGATAE